MDINSESKDKTPSKLKKSRKIKLSRYDLTHSSNSIPSLHTDDDEDDDEEYDYYIKQKNNSSGSGDRSDDSDTSKIISEYFNRTFKKMMNSSGDSSNIRKKSIKIQTINSSSENEWDSDNNNKNKINSCNVEELNSSEDDFDTHNSDSESESSSSEESEESGESLESEESEDSTEGDELSYANSSEAEDSEEENIFNGSDYEGYVENETKKIIKNHNKYQNYNLEEVSKVINSCDDLVKQKRILFNMLLAENFMETSKSRNSTNSNPLVYNKKKLVTFAKHIMNIELSDISPTILKSNQFKSFYLDYYRDVFQKALNLTNLKYGKSKSTHIPVAITKYKLPQDDVLLDMSHLGGHSQNTFFKRYDKEFTEVSKLGSGGFGSVFLVKKKSIYLDDQHYAVKKINFSIVLGNSHQSTSSKLEKIFREVKALSVLDHPNILRYFNAWIEIDTKSDTPKFSSVEGSMNTEDIDEDEDECTFENSSVTQDTSKTIDFSSSICTNKFRRSMSIVPYVPLPTNHASLSRTTSSITNDFIENVGIAYDTSGCTRADLPNKKLSIPQPHPLRIKYLLYIQTQYCEGNCLKEFIDGPSFPQQPKLLLFDIFQQIITGIQYIHSMNIIHRDIKPANIFIHNHIIKIGDFGLAKEFSFPDSQPPSPPEEPNNINNNNNNGETSNSRKSIELNNSLVNLQNTRGIGTQSYSSPEQLTQSTYTNKVDIFSCGIILYELLFPFSTQSERVDHISNLKKSVLPTQFIEKYPEESQLILKLINKDPQQRPSANEILEIHLPPLKNKYLNTCNSNQTANNITNYESLDKEALILLLIERDIEIVNLKNEICNLQKK